MNPGGPVSTASVNPTVRRRRLGAELRKLREQKGLTAEEVAQQLLVSQSKISRLENGRRSISQRDVRDLCTVYGVTDEGMVEGLMAMARESRQRGWWHAFGDLPYSVYIGLEAEASRMLTYESLLIPGLLQTRDYAAASVAGIEPDRDAEAVARRVDVRMRRQERIDGDKPLDLWVVMDEAALTRVVGNKEIMREQLEHLLELSERPHVNIQVLPFEAGAHPGMTGTFSIIEFPESADTAVVYLEGVTSDLYLEKEAEVRRYTGLYTHLQASALSTAESRARIREKTKKEFSS
ncbi:helix-turn-helix domain-containing protein [Streptacidiphilus monticola]|jgi:transcriptional regulator with XRE-family HTH domain|uniref:Helix-turn-helix domain-containing protein n=1 Tax=Streptacidiphilus monticola TaxID=2161674 RepID=A0ABW1FVG8_9ACTN